MTKTKLQAIRAFLSSLSDREVAAVVYAAAEGFMDDITTFESARDVGMEEKEAIELRGKLMEMVRE